jgi:hypothetical protein
VKILATLFLILCLGSSSVWAAPVAGQTEQTTPDSASPDSAPPNSGSVDSASPNRIPPAEPCPTLARRFLVRGSYDSSDIGSRLWNLAKIHSASAQSDQEKVCLGEISKQADSDEADYWDYIARKYKCEDDHGKLPRSKPSACPESKWKLVSENMNWLQALSGTQATGDATAGGDKCPPPPSSFHPQLKAAADVGAALGGIPNPHPETPERTIDSHVNLGTILAQQEPVKNCSSVKDRTKLNQQFCDKDEKNCGTMPSAAKDAEKCVAGLFKGIVDNIKDLFVDTAHLIKAAGSKILAFLRAVYKGGAGTVAREYAFHPKEVAAHIWDALKAIPDAIMNMAATQLQTWQCYNNAARWDMGCSAVGYLGMDALMFVPGFQELAIAKLGKLPMLGKAFEALDIAKEATIGKAASAAKSVGRAGVILVGEAAIKAGEVTYKFLSWVGKATEAAFKKLTWFRDSSTGLMVAEDGPKVVVKVGENVEEVTSAPVRSLLTKAIDFVKGNRSLAKVDTNAAKSLRQIAEEDAAGKKGMQLSLDFNPEAKQMKFDFDGAAAKSDKGAQAAHAGSTAAPKSVPEVVAPEAPKPGFFRRALDNYKDPELKAKQMEINLAKKSAPLPEGYVKDPILPPTATLEEKAAQLQQNGERAASFLGMKLTDAGEALIKDAKGVEQTFKLAEDGDGVGWFTKGKLPDKIKPEFTVNIDIPPEKMSKALPGIMSRAEYRGAETYFIGGSSKALENGGRMMISFADAKEAKRFQQSVEFFMDRNFYNVPSRVQGAGIIANAKWAGKVAGKVATLTVKRPTSVAFKALNWGTQATVESTVLSCFDNVSCQRHVYTSQTVFTDARTKCQRDNLCICKLYFQAGINPDTDEPIETSPFTCTTTSVNPNQPGDGAGAATEEIHKEMVGPDGKPIILQTTDHSGESDDGRAARLQKEFNDAAHQAADNPNGDTQPTTGPIVPAGQSAPTP